MERDLSAAAFDYHAYPNPGKIAAMEQNFGGINLEGIKLKN